MTTRKKADPVGRRGLKLTKTSTLPIYHQLYVLLRQQILDGVFQPDGMLPSEFSLSERFGVSRVTVRRTLSILQKDGLVERRRGVGTFAIQTPEEDTNPPISGMLENLITIGLNTQAETLLFETTVPPGRVLSALGLEGAEPCIKIERCRFHNQTPFSFTTIWVPPSLAPLLEDMELDDRPVISMLESKGVRAVSADQTLSAVASDDRAAQILGITIGVPLIRLRRTVFDSDGVAVLFQQSVYIPERYEYHMLLSRDNSNARPHWRHIG